MRPVLGPFSLERAVRAVERVRERLQRAVRTLEGAGVPYAVAGGNAVALWVSRVDEAAVRNTQDVDILLRREDFDRAREAMAAAGFTHRHVSGIDMFLDGPNAKPRDAVHVVFANEKVRPHEAEPAPDVMESERAPGYAVLSLDALLRVKLTAFRDKDRTHVRDLIGVGLVDASFVAKLPSVLAERLQQILDTPEG
ncbi:MAG: nucleotidyltransferase family protein [Planctomycetota bacterium]|nr:nucleotidyltransferase family protein [Planctomycetota bacterium]